jgi:hypothetical protein
VHHADRQVSDLQFQLASPEMIERIPAGSEAANSGLTSCPVHSRIIVGA